MEINRTEKSDENLPLLEDIEQRVEKLFDAWQRDGKEGLLKLLREDEISNSSEPKKDE